MNRETVKGDSAERMVETKETKGMNTTRGRDEETGRFISIPQPVECKCLQCGCTDWAWEEDAPSHICLDCFACDFNAGAVGRSPDELIVEAKLCHTHGEYSEDLPLCPDCKSPLDMDLPK